MAAGVSFYKTCSWNFSFYKGCQFLSSLMKCQTPTSYELEVRYCSWNPGRMGSMMWNNFSNCASQTQRVKLMPFDPKIFVCRVLLPKTCLLWCVCACVQKSLFSAIWSSCWLDSLQHSCALTPVHFCCGWPWFAMILRWYSETVFNKLYRQYNPSRLPLSGELMY